MATVLHWVALFLCLQCQLLGRTAAFRPTVRQDASLRAEKTSSWLAYQHRTMPELVLSKGYPLEEHFVTTGDGYVLGVYRIPHGKINSVPGGKRPPVVLQHGLLDSSAAWVLNDPDQSLAFLLADAGFDVFMGNSRGNAFSRNHTGIDPSTAAFWDFTWDDMAAYDIPALVGFALEQTGYQQLVYVGHSQGTTQMFAALSSSAELRGQVSLAAMLAPAVYMRFISSVPMVTLANIQLDRLFDLLGPPEFLPSRRITADLFGEICKTSPDMCVSVLTAIAGFNGKNINMTRMPDYVEYAPSGTSVKNMAKWAQAIRKSREQARPLFQKYDYGSVCHTRLWLPRNCNRRVYGSDEPPSYNLTAIDTPVAIFLGGQDKLATPLDVEALLEVLPPPAVVHSQVEPNYEHLDFTWGVTAAHKIYRPLRDLLQQYQPQPQTTRQLDPVPG